MSAARFEIARALARAPGAESLAIGDRAKLCFLGPCKPDIQPRDERGRALPWTFAGESMWVQIDLVDDVGAYIGWLRNQPVAIEGEIGDRVMFLADHVIEFKRFS